MARSQSAWGIDVGTTALKALKLRREGEKVAVEAFDVIEHEKFLTEPDVNRDEVVRHTLQKFLDRNQINRGLVFVSVPSSSTFAKFVKLPPVEPKKIPEIVRFEAIQQIPFPLDQVNWDYQTFQNADAPDVEVGIFAMKKDLVAQVLGNFQASKMVVGGVQMSPLAVCNALKYDGTAEGKGTVILDIGAGHTDLIIMDQGRLSWMRTLNIGGNNFTDALAKSFKFAFNKAELLKKNAATSKYARQVFQAMRPVFADLVAEVQRSIGFYNSSHRESKLERIIGMGNPFKLPQIQKYLQQNLSMEVIRLETFNKANADGKLAAGLNEHILSMPASYGLALQALDMAAIDTNLLPMDLARQMVWARKTPWFGAAAALIVVASGMWIYKPFQDAATFAKSLNDPTAKANVAVIADATKASEAYHSQQTTFNEDLASLRQFINLGDQRTVWPMIVTDILSALPQEKNPRAADPSLPRLERQLIVLKSISSVYRADIPAGGTAAAPKAGGEHAMGAGHQFGGPSGMQFTGAPGMGPGGPPAMGGPPNMGPGGGGSPSSPASAAPGMDHGFEITLVGYTPNKNKYDFVNNFATAIAGKAPVDAKDRPYHFVFANPSFTGYPLGPVPGNAIWGAPIGPYPEMFQGILQTPKPVSSGISPIGGRSGFEPGGGPPMGLPASGGTSGTANPNEKGPIDPNTGEDMSNDWRFEMKFLVVLKDLSRESGKEAAR